VLRRPYLFAAYALAALCFPALLVKTVLFRYTADAVPAAVLFVLTTSFCWLHVFAARWGRVGKQAIVAQYVHQCTRFADAAAVAAARLSPAAVATIHREGGQA
jgi:hypothetical protein